MSNNDLSMRGLLERGLCTLRQILRMLVIGPITRIPPMGASQIVVTGAANVESFIRFQASAGQVFYLDAINSLTVRFWGTTTNASGALSLTEVSNLIAELHKATSPATLPYEASENIMALSFASPTANTRITIWRESDLLPWCESVDA